MKRLVEGKIIVLGGDFRLILHVVRIGSITDIMKTIVILHPFGKTEMFWSLPRIWGWMVRVQINLQMKSKNLQIGFWK